MSVTRFFRRASLSAVAAVTLLVVVTGSIGPAGAASPITQRQARCEPPVPAPLVGVDLERIPTNQKVVALTFDAGANAEGVSDILQTLQRMDVPGTFFLTGHFAQTFPEIARRIAESYPVGNHSSTHPDLTKLSDAQVKEQIHNAGETIQQVTGQDPRPLFRFPLGARDARTLGIVNELCYAAFRWTVDTLGWKGTSGGMTVDKVVQRVLSAAQEGEIVLMHVGSHPTDRSTLDADALPHIITELGARGYDFVSLPDALSRGR